MIQLVFLKLQLWSHRATNVSSNQEFFRMTSIPRLLKCQSPTEPLRSGPIRENVTELGETFQVVKWEGCDFGHIYIRATFFLFPSIDHKELHSDWGHDSLKSAILRSNTCNLIASYFLRKGKSFRLNNILLQRRCKIVHCGTRTCSFVEL